MKTKIKISILAVLLNVALTSLVHSQSMGFLYQGQLSDHGGPAEGSYDLVFSLHDAAVAGNQVGVSLTNSAVVVSNGLLIVTLDFGAEVFDGSDRWLQIEVGTNGVGVFSSLSPRQPITAVPYGLWASRAGAVADRAITSAMLADKAVTSSKIAPGAVSQLGTPDGEPADVLLVNETGSVGIGTSEPGATLHVGSGQDILAPKVLFQVSDESTHFTNLEGSITVASSDGVLAVAAPTDSAVTLIETSQSNTFFFLRSEVRDNMSGFNYLGGASGVALSGRLLAVAAAEDHAVTLISVTNVGSPVPLADLRGITSSSFNKLRGASAVILSGNLLAVAAALDDAVTLADITNPSNPVFLSVMIDEFEPFVFLEGASSLAISGNLLAIGASVDNAVTLVDISNPASPILRASLRHFVGNFTNLAQVTSVALSGNLLAIAAKNSSAVTLVDVTNPANPVKRAELVDGRNGVETLGGACGVALQGDLLAITASADGAVTWFDVADPSHPRKVAMIKDNLAEARYLWGAAGMAFAGADLVVASQYDDAVSVFRLVSTQAGLISQNWVGMGTDTPVAPLHVVGSVTVEDATLFDINASHVELGRETSATGTDAIALGRSTTANGREATALGAYTTASGIMATAMGGYSTADGFVATAMGRDTTASGDYSTAMGWSTIASGDYSIAAGYDTQASGSSSVSMGGNNVASGSSAVALGYDCRATHQGSFAAGRRARASHDGAFVWADQQNAEFASTANNQFNVRAHGGVWFETSGRGISVDGSPLVTGELLHGNGSELTSLNASQLASGTVADARLSSNIPRLDTSATFTGSVTATGDLVGTRLGVGSGHLMTKAYSSIAGGLNNFNHAEKAHIGGGQNNGVAPDGIWGNISGGQGNRVGRSWATVGGGFECLATNAAATVGGGYNNTASGNSATIPGGADNLASGNYSFAAGRFAQATHVACVVFSGGETTASFGDRTFTARAHGGARFYSTSGTATGVELAAGGNSWSAVSDRNVKDNLAVVDTQAVLEKVAALPVTTWNLKSQPEKVRHIGPMAQDFAAAFGVGEDDRHISSSDADGVALAAIQGLNQKLEQQAAELESKDMRIAALEQALAELMQTVSQLVSMQTSQKPSIP